jgi:hypothetical protein
MRGQVLPIGCFVLLSVDPRVQYHPSFAFSTLLHMSAPLINLSGALLSQCDHVREQRWFAIVPDRRHGATKPTGATYPFSFRSPSEIASSP